MPRIAFIADSHYDESSRFEECRRIHQWIADDIAGRGVDLVIHGGDIFERRSTPRERAAVAEWLRMLAEQAPVVIVRGNHDAPGDLSLFARLRTRHPVIVEEAAGVHVVAGVAVGCLAWPRKAEMLARLADAGHEDTEQAARLALQNVIGGLGDEMAKHDGPGVLVAHAMVRASKVSTGQPLVGCDLEVGLEDLQLARASAVLLGHIHLPQEWHGDGEWWGPVIYAGSPRRTAFGEIEEKSYLLVDIGSEPVGWKRVATPATPMYLFHDEWSNDTPDGTAGWVAGPPDPPPEGAEIRFRYRVAADQREAAKSAAETVRARLLEQGAVVVKIEEEVITTLRARAPEVARARSTAEKLRAYWRARDDEPERERAIELLCKAHTLEEEVAHAV